MKDWEIVLNILLDRKWHHVLEIMERGKPGTRNWAVRSRISDLKKRGYVIEARVAKIDGMAEYRLVMTPEDAEAAEKAKAAQEQAVEEEKAVAREEAPRLFYDDKGQGNFA